MFLKFFWTISRFKQLKEQEARKKQQKEAEKAKQISLTKEAIKGDTDTKVNLEKADSDSDSIKSLNGNVTSSDSNQAENTSMEYNIEKVGSHQCLLIVSFWVGIYKFSIILAFSLQASLP